MMEDEGGAVVDEPQPPVPAQHVGVARGAVHVGDEGVEPHDRRRELEARRLGQQVEGDRPGQEVERDVEAAAGADQVLDLGVGLGARELGVELHQHDLGHVEAEGARDLAAHQLGDQRFRALAGAAELEHVHAVVVGFHERRQ